MTFLQPFILWGLPLVLLPVLIHFINRMRHRRQPWAAMQFLLSATRSSISHARLRQWLVLLFRVLAVLALVLFLARPLAGGWLGWALSPAPDAILVLLDRSPSMETRLPDGSASRREHALTQLVQAAEPYDETSHLVLIDSGLRTAQEVGRARALTHSTLSRPVDAAADMPALFETALDWISDNKAGTSELWVASDLQASNWNIQDPRWTNIVQRMSNLPQSVRVRLLDVSGGEPPNRSISVHEMIRRNLGGNDELEVVLDIRQQHLQREDFPLIIDLAGVQREVRVPMESRSLRWRHRIDLSGHVQGGWGRFKLPADANERDNTAWFVFGASRRPNAVLTTVLPEPRNALVLGVRAVTGSGESATTLEPGSITEPALQGTGALFWQGPLPGPGVTDVLRDFIEQGGVVVFFPPGTPDAASFLGYRWSAAEEAAPEKPFHISNWNHEDGPLADTDEGFSLPLDKVQIVRRQVPLGPGNALAAFGDNQPFLLRGNLGAGEFYLVATLPHPDWSSLSEGPVLIPWLQRILEAGSRRLQSSAMAVAGDFTRPGSSREWAPLQASAADDVRIHAGVYTNANQWLAVNPPPLENDPRRVANEDVEAVLQTLGLRQFNDSSADEDVLQGEVWRWFLFAMLLFLLAEGWLILPRKPEFADRRIAHGGQPRAEQREEVLT